MRRSRPRRLHVRSTAPRAPSRRSPARCRASIRRWRRAAIARDSSIGSTQSIERNARSLAPIVRSGSVPVRASASSPNRVHAAAASPSPTPSETTAEIRHRPGLLSTSWRGMPSSQRLTVWVRPVVWYGGPYSITSLAARATSSTRSACSTARSTSPLDSNQSHARWCTSRWASRSRRWNDSSSESRMT